jgi:hypothetical protein
MGGNGSGRYGKRAARRTTAAVASLELGDFAMTPRSRWRWSDSPFAQAFRDARGPFPPYPRERYFDLGTRHGRATATGGASIPYTLDVQENGVGLLTLRHGIFPQAVPLCTTRQPSGGLRWWMRCRCSRRVGKLYRLPTFGADFACRICLELVYESQRRDRIAQAEAMADKLYDRASQPRLHEKTRARILHSAEYYGGQYLSGIVAGVISLEARADAR